LFSGREVAPKVSKDEVLLVTNQREPISNLLDLEWDWLKSVGLDQSTPYRGINVIKSDSLIELEHLTKDFNIGVYKPT
jgi:hypothetical protein